MCGIVTDWLKIKLCTNCEDLEVPPPEVVGTIDNTNLDPILKEALGNIPIFYGDQYYHLVTLESFKTFLEHDQTDKYRYDSDSPDGNRFDCNSFSTRLCGNLRIPGWASAIVGQIWVSNPSHSIVLFVDANLDVYYVEGQTDQVFLVKDKPEWIPRVLYIG